VNQSIGSFGHLLIFLSIGSCEDGQMKRWADEKMGRFPEERMKKLLLVLVLLFGLGAVAQQAGPPPDLEIPNNMKQYFVVFLVENANGKAHDDPQMMKKHLAFIRGQVESGKVVLVGPFTDNGKIAGMFIMDVPTADDAKNLLASEPMTSAGWVVPEVHSAMLPDISAVKITYPEKKAQ
jgi:uncharacterized protein YciI